MLGANADVVPKTGFLRKEQVLSLFGFSDSTLRRRIKAGVLPEPIKKNEVSGERVRYWNATDMWAIQTKMLGMNEGVGE